MSEGIIIAIINAIGIIVVGFITKGAIMAELDKRIALLSQSLDTIKDDVKEHNHYAKMFQETIPVIQQQMKVMNHRVGDLESHKDN